MAQMSQTLFARPALPIHEYLVGWICPLPKELTAARAILDEEHEMFKSQSPLDDNSYVLGRCCGHNIVIACLPLGRYGTVSAATVANNMLRTFTSIQIGLVIGIGGGIPNPNKGIDIRLGDVVVSQPDGTHGGVVQYDLRKNLGGGKFERKGLLRPPPTLLLTALATLQSQHHLYGNQIQNTLSTAKQRFPRLALEGYVHPGLSQDVLYCGHLGNHVGGYDEDDSCSKCQNGIVNRTTREDDSPKIHYGVIVSGNELMKNAIVRDQLGQEFNAKCIEMEAAGLMDDFPCVVIRGICDYADSHKNDIWQEYAALTAAGFAKELMATVKWILIRGNGNAYLKDTLLLSDESSPRNSITQQRSGTMDNVASPAAQQALLADLDFGNSNSKRAQLSLPDIGTECFRWIETSDFFTWLRATDSPAFLIVGKPASGKSTLMRYLSDSKKVRDELSSKGHSWTVVHYFLDYRAGSSPANDPAGMIRLFARQLAGINQNINNLLQKDATIQRLKTPDIEQCIDVFSDLISQSHIKICAFVDGLDEYSGSLWELCNVLDLLRHRTGIKMCVASRPEPEILRACRGWPSLVLQECNEQSMLLYIQRRIDMVATFEPELEELFTGSLRNKIVVKARGVILWVKLAMEELLQPCQIHVATDGLAERLASLEPDLGALYERNLERIPQHLKHDAALILLLLSEAALDWQNDTRVLLQAIQFLQRRNGFHKFLGGNFELRSTMARVAAFLPNLIDVKKEGERMFSHGDDIYSANPLSFIRLTHLSLAAHLRKTVWISTHLHQAIRESYHEDVWRRLMIEVLKAVNIENAIDVRHVFNGWHAIEQAAARSRIAKHCGISVHNFSPFDPHELEVKGASLSVSWTPFQNLVNSALLEAPDVLLPNENSSLLESFGCVSEVLNWPCMVSHILKCGICRGTLTRQRTVEDLRGFADRKMLDIVLAVWHRRSRYLQDSIIGSRALSTEDVEKLLDLANSYTSIRLDELQESVLKILCEGVLVRCQTSSSDEVASSTIAILGASFKRKSRQENTSDYSELLDRATIMASLPDSHVGTFDGDHCVLVGSWMMLKMASKT